MLGFGARRQRGTAALRGGTAADEGAMDAAIRQRSQAGLPRETLEIGGPSEVIRKSAAEVFLLCELQKIARDSILISCHMYI